MLIYLYCPAQSRDRCHVRLVWENDPIDGPILRSPARCGRGAMEGPPPARRIRGNCTELHPGSKKLCGFYVQPRLFDGASRTSPPRSSAALGSGMQYGGWWRTGFVV